MAADMRTRGARRAQEERSGAEDSAYKDMRSALCAYKRARAKSVFCYAVYAACCYVFTMLSLIVYLPACRAMRFFAFRYYAAVVRRYADIICR